MSSSPAIFVRPLCLQIFLGGVVLEYINLIQAVDLNDELILRQNNLLERLSTQLSNIPTKDDLASLEAKFERGIERERRQNGDLKTKLQIMSNAMTKKLDGLQNTIDNFRGLVKFMVEECINSCLENKPRSKRSTPNLPNAVKTELDFRNLSDYRLVLLTTQWLQKGFNNFTDQLATVERHQHEILKEIRNTSSGVSQGVDTVLREVASLKYYIRKI
ncbi:uncharacterized protein LOC110856169 isoform X4 [Folsomia candida]|uniref:uncharacterized protein LOC110856169 isoform X4 n=1 Tax=Folsomia candida TaxID=158441 RepID=UPI000B8FFDB2|nr:uncharacterized protein LOC110856169 isoform X4 [Folsomia candida]